MATTITKQANGRLLLSINGVEHSLRNTDIYSDPEFLDYIILGDIAITTTAKSGLKISWKNITSPVVTSRNDAVEKIGLLLESGSGIQQFVISGGTGATVTITDFTLTGNYRIWANGALMTPLLYSSVGNVITFSPPIADGITITVIKF